VSLLGDAVRPCPCGTGETYDACCGPLHRGAVQAETPERLMRSRYAAYALGDHDYVWRTWHPRTRPLEVRGPSLRWTGLVVHEATGDEVEFTATHTEGRLHERSRFARRAGRWFYLEATDASTAS
jgi:SEC-C motif domain protein